MQNNIFIHSRHYYRSRIFERTVSPFQPVFNIFVIFSWKSIKQSHELDLAYLYTYKRIMLIRNQIVGKYQNEMPKVAGKAFPIREIWNPLCCHGNNTLEWKELSKNNSKQQFPFCTFYLFMFENGSDWIRCKFWNSSTGKCCRLNFFLV